MKNLRQHIRKGIFWGCVLVSLPLMGIFIGLMLLIYGINDVLSAAVLGEKNNWGETMRALPK